MTAADSPSADPNAREAYREAQDQIAQAARDSCTFLGLSGMGLTSVPPEIGQLANLTELDLNHNQLTSVPPEIGQLAKLTRLSLFKNRLTSVPPEIGQLANLTRLDLDNNQLAALPKSLRQCSRLRALFLHGNPRLNLPASVLGVSLDDWDGEPDTAPKPGPILDYYFRTRDESKRRPLCEGKLILVGRGDVGKTSLVRRLIDNSFSPREDTTQGIRIRKLPVVAGRKKDTNSAPTRVCTTGICSTHTR